MTEKLLIWYFDDNPDRSETASQLGKRLDVKVEFINLKDKNIIEIINTMITRVERPELILMDHFFTKSKDGINTGSTAAEIIREQWQDQPIMCVTGAKPSTLNLQMKSLYDEVIEENNISQYDEVIVSVAQSCKNYRAKPATNLDEILLYINTPDDDINKITNILPEELKNEGAFKSDITFRLLMEWIRHSLMKRPGFLYDRLWTATLLGVKEKSFNKIESYFEEAKYNGIFSNTLEERWWKSSLLNILYSKFPENDIIYPWVLGREFSELSKDDYSISLATGKEYPETVAFTDELAGTRGPMLLSETIPHPNFIKILYFEEIRMMGNPDEY